MNITQFIRAINETIPSIDQIIGKYKQGSRDISVQEAEMLQNEFRLTIRNVDEEGSLLEDLIYNTNMSEEHVQIGSIMFRRDIKVINESFQWFATYNDFDRICLSVKDRSIVWFEGNEEDYNELAISLEQFLSFMYIYDRYDKSQVWKFDFPKSEFSIELKDLIENGLSEWFVSTLMPDWPWQ